RNAQDGISMIQTAEGGLNETHSILQRMRELAVQASSDTLTSADRTSITTEVSQLVSEIDNIATNTKFNTKSLLNGSLGVKQTSGTLVTGSTTNITTIDVTGADNGVTYTLSAAAGVFTLINGTTGAKVTLSAVSDGANTLDFGDLGVVIKTNSSFIASAALNSATIVTSGSSATFQIGADQGQTMSISISDMQASALSVNSLDLSTNTTAAAAITTLDAAITTVSDARAKLGAYQNRLEHTINNLGTASENLTASESRIRDVDMANEMMSFTKNNILQQAATAMLAQANQQPETVLQLLK
ncbi:MAG: flagellin, partial [Ignavibacteriales bacterium]